MRSPLQRSLRSAASAATAAWCRARGSGRGRARILYYHRIDPEQHRSCVHPDAFAEQMALLRREGWNVLRFREIRTHLDQRRPFPERTVVITLDDGFADNYHRAFPVLQREGLPATIFLTAGFIGKGILPVLRDHPGAPALDWAQVREMAGHGIDFGAHTVTHRSLTGLPAEDLRQEVEGSRRIVEENLSRNIDSFCYPRGHFDSAAKLAVRDAGYLLACTTMPGCVSAETHPFSLRRTFIARDDSLKDFQRKLDGAFDLLHEISQRFRGSSPAPSPA